MQRRRSRLELAVYVLWAGATVSDGRTRRLSRLRSRSVRGRPHGDRDVVGAPIIAGGDEPRPYIRTAKFIETAHDIHHDLQRAALAAARSDLVPTCDGIA
jgi:hypothetical protein